MKDLKESQIVSGVSQAIAQAVTGSGAPYLVSNRMVGNSRDYTPESNLLEVFFKDGDQVYRVSIQKVNANEHLVAEIEGGNPGSGDEGERAESTKLSRAGRQIAESVLQAARQAK